ncbi:hypothetical protein C5D25_07365 [Rathayibacter sp. AY1D7]|uniref:phage tail tape measure protein n=1 Tax=Rathayibacter sp. AY1D7 TaxID=2080547 RepID=UPI000CE89139|nr:phage tail tape measure protein [Rathayibacter sp. AY1D7]PPH63117.1 hypothetical protein C5D25_07365 [Rathayibacter sp. AY1D7]
MAGLRAAELEVLFTANTDDVAKAEKDVKTAGDRIEKQKTTKKVDADARPALKGMERVEQAARKIVSAKTIATVDANIEKAEAATEAVRDRLDYLRSVETDLEVKADISRAEANLQRMQRELDALRSARTKIDIEVDTSGAEQAASGLADTVGDSGEDAGAKFSGSVIAALAAIPVAGSVIGIGVAIGQALSDGVKDGLQQEVGRDRLQALTGISEQDAARLGRTASEAYVNGFGESIEANMDTTRLGLQFDIIDPAASNRDSQKVIEGLAGIADVLEDDVQLAARATASLLSTGLAKSSQEAFDIFAAGAREGVNRGEDLLDTLDEYSSTFASIGLTGGQTLGLLNQGLKAGAPNTDFFADALRELGIRLRDGDDATAGFVEQVGLVPSSLQAAFAEGGPEAGKALDDLFDKLNQIEDPVTRNKVAVGLLGTQFEDLQFDVSKLDLSTAEASLNGVEGAAQRMFDTLASNDASQIEGALRSIEVAGDAVKGALAGAFGGGLGELADFVTENRGPVLQFLSDIVDGAIDFGQGIIESAADGTEAFGEFVAGPGQDVLLLLAQILHFMGRDTSDIMQLVDEMGQFDEKTDAAAERIRGLSGNLEEGRGRFHEFFDPQIDLGVLSDRTRDVAQAIDDVGVSAESGAPLVDAYSRATDGSVRANTELEGQIRASIGALSDQIGAAAATGESQDALRGRYDEGTAALVNQLTQMGLTEQEARDLIATYGAVPELVETAVVAQTAEAEARIRSVRDLVNSIPTSKSVTVNYSQNGVAYSDSRESQQARGSVLEFYAAGGLRAPGLTPMQPIAQMVPASTWRVVGDRSDVPEAYIPLDGSPRSMAILAETMRRMGVEAMSEGGTTTVATQRPRAADRPVYMDGGALFGVIREVADGSARLIVADALDRRTQDARRMKWR